MVQRHGWGWEHSPHCLLQDQVQVQEACEGEAGGQKAQHFQGQGSSGGGGRNQNRRGNKAHFQAFQKAGNGCGRFL